MCAVKIERVFGKKEITSQLAEADLMRIISMARGAGFDNDLTDEYDIEAEQIAPRLSSCVNVAGLEDVIKEVFDYFFDSPEIPQLLIRKAALMIWKEWKGLVAEEEKELEELNNYRPETDVIYIQVE